MALHCIKYAKIWRMFKLFSKHLTFLCFKNETELPFSPDLLVSFANSYWLHHLLAKNWSIFFFNYWMQNLWALLWPCHLIPLYIYCSQSDSQTIFFSIQQCEIYDIYELIFKHTWITLVGMITEVIRNWTVFPFFRREIPCIKKCNLE